MCGITGWANLNPRAPALEGAEDLLHSMVKMIEAAERSLRKRGELMELHL